MSSKCTAAKAYDILGIYDFPDNFDALNGLHSYLYTNSDMVVEAPAYTHGVSNDAFDYEFDDDDIPVFSAPEDL